MAALAHLHGGGFLQGANVGPTVGDGLDSAPRIHPGPVGKLVAGSVRIVSIPGNPNGVKGCCSGFCAKATNHLRHLLRKALYHSTRELLCLQSGGPQV